MARGLTDRQRSVLDFVKAHFAELGYPPTLREIGLHMGIKSTNGVNDHLLALERKGLIVRSSEKARGITVVGWSDAPRGDQSVANEVASGEVLRAARKVVESCSASGVISWHSEAFSMLVRALAKTDAAA